jgi:centrin-3
MNRASFNAHATPRPYPMRSLAGPSNSNAQNPAPRNAQGKQPERPQEYQNDDYANISDEDREHIDEVFDLMDMKKKGWLNSYEFRHSLSALGFDLAKPDYFRLLETHGSIPPDWPEQQNCPGNRLLVYIDQFRACAANLMVNRDPREEATKVFNMFDYDGDGIISFEDMRHLAQEIREDRAMSDEEIQAMIQHLDHDGKGGVNLEEFIQMMEEAAS